MNKEKLSATSGDEKKADTADVGANVGPIGGEFAPVADLALPDFSPEQKALIGAVVVETLKEILPPIVEAQVLALIEGDKVILSGPSLADIVEGIRADVAPLLTEMVVQALPEVRAAREEAEAKAAIEQRAETAREASARAARAQQDEAEKKAKLRAKAVVKGQASWDRLFGQDGCATGFRRLDVVTSAMLLLDDGKGFCIDFSKQIDAEYLADAGDVLRLTSKIDLPADIDPFAVSGVVLMLGEGQAMRCEIPTPLHIGGGRGAHLAADSLVFRIPAAAAA